MSKADTAKRRIENQIIKNLGSGMVYYALVSSTVDEWGDATDVYGGLAGLVMPVTMPATFSIGSSTVIKSVPFNYIFKKKDFQPFGDVPKGSLMMAISADLDVNVRDKFEIKSKTFFVQDVEHFVMQDVNIVKVLLLVEKL